MTSLRSLTVFVPVAELRQLTGIGEGQFHRIIARLEKDDLTNDVTPVIREASSGIRGDELEGDTA